MDKTINTTRLTTAQEEALTRMADQVSKIGKLSRGYNVACAISDLFRDPWLDGSNLGPEVGPFRELMDAIEEIGTPSAIEVANHIREDLKNV